MESKENNTSTEEEQLNFIAQYGVYDKDVELDNQIKKNSHFSTKKEFTHKFSKQNNDDLFTVDLHGFSVAEAIAEVEETIHVMEKSKIKNFRVIHGGGNPGYGPIKKALDRQFRGPLRNKVKSYSTENYNSGSSIIWLL